MAKLRTQAVDISELELGLESLKRYREPIARAMGVEMGQIVRDEAKARAPVLKPENKGHDPQRAGQLRDAIYLAFDGRRHTLNPGQFVYGVSWNAKKAPHGHMLEFGHWMPYIYRKDADGYYTPGGHGKGTGIPNPKGPVWISQSPFLGPAFDAKLPVLQTAAINAAQQKFRELTNGD